MAGLTEARGLTEAQELTEARGRMAEPTAES